MANFNSKPILAFDCATPEGSVAVRLGKHHAQRTLPAGKHAALLLPVIQELLLEFQITTHDLAAIVTPIGPGSFTGLRIALATTHGLHAASNVPLKCPTTLEALAFQFFHEHTEASHVIALLNVGKGDVAWQEFARTDTLPEALGTIQLTAENDVAPYIQHRPTIGNVAALVSHAVSGVNAHALCQMAAWLPVMPISEAMPLYIRPPDAKIPSPPAWLASSPRQE
jgi:tRNA threonylcarbamoyl adenosine modification protein YeaZ